VAAALYESDNAIARARPAWPRAQVTAVQPTKRRKSRAIWGWSKYPAARAASTHPGASGCWIRSNKRRKRNMDPSIRGETPTWVAKRRWSVRSPKIECGCCRPAISAAMAARTAASTRRPRAETYDRPLRSDAMDRHRQARRGTRAPWRHARPKDPRACRSSRLESLPRMRERHPAEILRQAPTPVRC